MKKIQTIRINDEIKVLYKKKEKPNIDLYSIHLKAAQEWGRTWYFIVDCIHESINQELEKKYKPIEEKLKNLVHTQTKTLDCKSNFYPRVINKTDLTFTNDELTLLNKGLKYNLNHKHKKLDKNSCPGSRDRYNSITYIWTGLYTQRERKQHDKNIKQQ